MLTLIRYDTFCGKLPRNRVAIDSGSTPFTTHPQNVPGVLSKINNLFAEQGINISGQSLMTKGDIGYLVMDVDASASQEALDMLHEVEGTIRVRVLF